MSVTNDVARYHELILQQLKHFSESLDSIETRLSDSRMTSQQGIAQVKEDLKDELQKMKDVLKKDIAALSTEVAILKLKAGIAGLVAGAIVSSLIQFFLR